MTTGAAQPLDPAPTRIIPTPRNPERRPARAAAAACLLLLAAGAQGAQPGDASASSSADVTPTSAASPPAAASTTPAAARKRAPLPRFFAQKKTTPRRSAGGLGRVGAGYSILYLAPPSAFLAAYDPTDPDRSDRDQTPAAEPASDATQSAPAAESADTSASSDITLLPTVMVIGERDDFALRDSLSPGLVSIARPDDVKGEHKSIPDLLDQIPGVYVRRQSGSAHYTTASIRGSAPSQVNIYIDGIPMNLANEMAADISTLPISNVERVEVYRGTTPARFSGAPIGGAINIVTKKPTEFLGSISIGRRSFHGEQYATDMHFPLLGGHMLIGLDRDASEGDFKYTDKTVKTMNSTVYADGSTPASMTNVGALPNKRTRQANRVDKENALFKWESERFIAKFAATDLDRMLPTAVANHESYSFHLQDVPRFTPSFYNQEQRQVMRKREALAGWRDSFGPLDAALNLTWLRNEQSYRNGWAIAHNATGVGLIMGGAWNDYATTRKGVAGDLVRRFNEGGNFAHQVEVHAEYYKEKLEADLSDFIIDSDFLSRFRRKKRNVQVQDMITIAPLGNLQVTPIVRAEKLSGPVIGSKRHPHLAGSGDYDWQTTGSLNFKKAFDSGWQVFGGAGSYIRFPNFYEIYGNGWGIVPLSDSTGRTESVLLPEKGRTLDLGVGWQGRLSENLRANFRLTAFQRKTQDNITLLSTPIAAKYVNAGDAIFRGFELEGNLAWGRRADLQFALTRQDAHFTHGPGYFYYPGTITPGQRHGGTIRVTGVPDVVANARLNVRFFGDALTTFIEANRLGRVYLDQDAWEEPLTTVNLGGSWAAVKAGPNKGLRLSFGVNDVFDKGPEQEVGGGIPGRELGVLGVSTFYYIIPANVQYPQQGRTFYATLNWSY